MKEVNVSTMRGRWNPHSDTSGSALISPPTSGRRYGCRSLSQREEGAHLLAEQAPNAPHGPSP